MPRPAGRSPSIPGEAGIGLRWLKVHGYRLQRRISVRAPLRHVEAWRRAFSPQKTRDSARSSASAKYSQPRRILRSRSPADSMRRLTLFRSRVSPRDNQRDLRLPNSLSNRRRILPLASCSFEQSEKLRASEISGYPSRQSLAPKCLEWVRKTTPFGRYGCIWVFQVRVKWQRLRSGHGKDGDHRTMRSVT
jgi:hypothetical protein